MKRVDYGHADLTKNEVYNLRKALNLTQVNLSKKLGVSLRTWCHYEYGTLKMPVSVHMALKYLENNKGEDAEKVHNEVKEYKEPLTKYDLDRIDRLRKTMREIDDESDLINKIMTQSDKEMGFLLSKINI